jgi:Ig-like domain CHU_C associated
MDLHRTRFFIVVAIVAVFSPVSRAATYVVPEDRELIRAATAIVVGTVTEAHPRRALNGMIETITRIAVEESIKGLGDARLVDVANFGGRLGADWMIVTGSPEFRPGERVLLFLERNVAGDWTTYSLGLGAFRFARDVNGAHVLTRGDEIFGWTEEGAVFMDRARLDRNFLDYVRVVACGLETSADYFAPLAINAHARRPIEPNEVFTSGSYSLPFSDDASRPIRRDDSSLTVQWRLIGSQPGLDLASTVDVGNAAWNEQSSLIHYERSATPASGDTVANDSESRVIANDPHGVVTGTCCPGVLAFAVQMPGGTHSFAGESFRTIANSDIVVNDGVLSPVISQSELADTMTHELGHTLGLRHSDKNTTNNGACALPLDCCIWTPAGGNCAATMNSFVIFESAFSGLQAWDKRAIDCLYDGECLPTTTCTSPFVFRQPVDKSIVAGGGSAILSVGASATPPLTYQWYVGNAGDTSTQIGDNSPDLIVTPTVITSYWVRVTGSCGAVDSNTVTVTVTSCPRVTLTNAFATSGSNGQVTLTANAMDGSSPRLSYRWFRGDTPGHEGTVVGTSRQAMVTVTARTSFWVTAENACNRNAVSELVFAAPCGLPSLVTQPHDQAISTGENAMLSLGIGDSGGDVSWFRGTLQDKTNPVGTGASIDIGPLTATTTYWASIANSCGDIQSRLITIVVTPTGRRTSVRH